MTTEGPVWVDEDFALKLAVQMRKEERIFHGTPIGDTLGEWALCLQSIADVLRARDDELSALRAHHSELVKKMNAACAFGTPDAQTAGEIVEEVRSLIQERDALQASVDSVRGHLTQLAMARSDDPQMGAHKLLSVLADLVDGVCEAVNYE